MPSIRSTNSTGKVSLYCEPNQQRTAFTIDKTMWSLAHTTTKYHTERRKVLTEIIAHNGLQQANYCARTKNKIGDSDSEKIEIHDTVPPYRAHHKLNKSYSNCKFR